MSTASTAASPTQTSRFDAKIQAVIDQADAARAAGICPLPVASNGTKMPYPGLGETDEKKRLWKRFQTEEPTNDEHRTMFDRGPWGLVYLCGAISGGLTMWEMEDANDLEKLYARAIELGKPRVVETVKKVMAGYSEKTPGGGTHLLYFCERVYNNTCLAKRPIGTDPKTKKTLYKPIYEIRGEGGLTVVAPSFGRTHKSGKPYVMLAGSVETIVTITQEEQDEWFEVCRSFDEGPRKNRKLRDEAEVVGGQPNAHANGKANGHQNGHAKGSTRVEGDPLRPGDDFMRKVDWGQILRPAGWVIDHTNPDGEVCWRRPGKDFGWSATTNYAGSDLLYVFTSSSEFEEENSYTKFGAYAVLNHGGDFTESAKALAKSGFGERRNRNQEPRVERDPHVNGKAAAEEPSADEPATDEHYSEPEPSIPVAEGMPVAKVGMEANEGMADPHRLGRVYIKKKYTHRDGLMLRFYQGQFYRWNLAYRVIPDKEVAAEVSRAVKVEFDAICQEQMIAFAMSQTQPKPPPKEGEKEKKEKPPESAQVTKRMVGDVTLAVASYTLLSGETKQPAWLIPNPPFPAEDVLPARNGLVHLPLFVARHSRAIAPPTPAYFSPYSVDYDFDPAAPRASAWLKFLDEIFPNDKASIALLQEWMGYLLTGDTRHHKILMLIGEKRSGKGTIARILQRMLGVENVANPTLSGLTTNFGLSPLIGKLAAIIGDARLSGRTDVAQVTERLLSISGEDNITIDRKHIAAWTGRLFVRFMILSNMLPKLDDASGALASRMLFLNFTQSFLGREDHELEGRLMAELPSILLWSISGWERLRKRGYFVQPDSGKSLVKEMESITSPVGLFVKERCKVGQGLEIITGNLFGAWKEWCDLTGREWSGNDQDFGRLLRSVIPGLETKSARYRDFDGKSIVGRKYCGVTLDEQKSNVGRMARPEPCEVDL